MQFTQMRFNPGNPATLVLKRQDGHELSLSSHDKGLVHFDQHSNTVKDYGSHTSTESLLAALAEFTA